jgi:hypothetical protein
MFDYDRKKDVNELLKDIQNVRIFNGSFDQQMLEYDLDLILNLGGTCDPGLLKIARYGVLHYSVDDQIGDIYPASVEVVEKSDVTNSSLLITENEIESVIFSSWESTCQFSINVNRNNVFWRNSLFMPRILEGIGKGGREYIGMQRNRFSMDDQPVARSRTSALLYFFNYMTSVAGMVYKKLMYSDDFNWHLLINIKDYDGFGHDYKEFRKIPSPRGVFWADPFVVKKDDQYYLFVEEYIYRKKKAHISVLTLNSSGTVLRTDKIIERPYHMSYPFVFILNGDYYMIPETGSNKAIELYRSTDFPYKWEFDRYLMENIKAVDTTLFYYKEKWWLFTSVDQTLNHSGNSTELFLFFTDDIFSGEWESHPCNPVVSDVRSARPAGKIFIHNGNIYRPSQDCSGRYGKAFNINRITLLTETEYGETLESKIGPEWDNRLSGTHTYNFDDDFTVIDVYSLRRRVERS